VDRGFRDLPALLQPGDLLVFNDTRVIKARLHGEKPTGGAVERWWNACCPATRCWPTCAPASRRARQRWCASTDAFDAEVLGRGGPDGRCSTCAFRPTRWRCWSATAMCRCRPTSPCRRRRRRERYQTVFAARPGAVAAPTAALHFDDAAAGRAGGARRQRAR
jgi:S-adenosylmethionine:tRNA ribosyltransferase-isomerase